MEKLKSNSIASKTENSPETKEITPITSNVTVKKQNEMSKIGKALFQEDIKSAGEHVVQDVILPSIKKLIVDSVKNSIDFLIYGGKTGQNNTGARTISYQNYYTSRTNPTPQPSYSKPAIYSVNDVIFTDRGEAEATLLRLKEEVDRYGMASVGDFYDLICQPSKYTDQKYGWRDLTAAQVVRNRDGFSIQFPKVSPLE